MCDEAFRRVEISGEKLTEGQQEPMLASKTRGGYQKGRGTILGAHTRRIDSIIVNGDVNACTLDRARLL